MNRKERRKQKVLTHKAQHYIAQGYTRAWCDPTRAAHEEPYVWLFDRDGPTVDKPGRRKAPVNIFKEPDMYTITPANDPGGRDLSLEHGLGRIESDFCAVRKDFIEPRKPLGARERVVVLAFAATTQFRTPGFREHTREQWTPILEMGREMEEQMAKATPEQRAKAARRPPSLASVGRERESFTLEQVQEIVDQPLQTMLAAHANALVPLLAKMTNFSIWCTEKTPGFITSDQPTVWFDPEWPKRPPMFQAPALMYETVEITMPISPTRMLFLGRQNEWSEFMDLDELDLDDRLLNELNRRTCRLAREKVVVSRNEFRSVWAEQGEPPADAWRAPGDDDAVVA